MISPLIVSFVGVSVISHGLTLLLSIAKWHDSLNSQSLVYDGDRQAPPDLVNLLPEGTDLDPDIWLMRHNRGSRIKIWENRQNLHVFNFWPVIYHTEKNSCGNPTPERLSVEIYTSQRDYPKSTRFYFVAIDVSQQKTVPV